MFEFGAEDALRKSEEQLCRKGATSTYNGHDRVTNEITYGGYSKRLVLREEFALRVPDGLDLSRTAPLLCAGITTYSPLRTWNVGPGSRVGVVGLGGLGHMAVKLAAALGADVTVMSRTIDTHVMSLRRKLEDDIARPRYLHTVRKAGYRFAAEPPLD